MKRLFYLALVILTFLGVLDSAYITYEKLTGFVPPCNIHFQCEQVLNSQWSHVGIVPLSAIGCLFYLSFFTLALLLYFGKKNITILHFRLSTQAVTTIFGIAGGSFSVYLLIVMGIVLKSWCLYCLFSAGICLMLFLCSSILYLHQKVKHEIHI